ncbi:unnamed protein product [Closterium sp. NIES-65]|nr:unnamed protein product [Closterium sp. NIES-65]
MDRPPAASLAQATAVTIAILPPKVTSCTVTNPLAAAIPAARSVTQSTSPENKHKRALESGPLESTHKRTSSVRFADDHDVEPGGSGDADGGGESGGGGGGGGGGRGSRRGGGSREVSEQTSADDVSSDGISLESMSRAGSQREREEWQLDYSQFEAARRDLDDGHGRLPRILKRRELRCCELTLALGVAGRNPVDGYYQQQNEMIDGFSEMDALSEQLLPPTPSEVREARRQHRNEFMAVQISNGANVCLFIVKIIASIVSGSLAILASTLDSLLDLLCGFILWYTARTMRRTNPYKYPIGKRRMQPLGIIVFACIMASLGFQILLEGVRKLTDSNHSTDLGEKWQVYVGIMGLVILTKFILFLYCRLFSDDIVQAYALDHMMDVVTNTDHMMDVVTNTVGLAAAVLAGEYAWWIDPVGAIFLALYTMFNWGNTVLSLTLQLAPHNTALLDSRVDLNVTHPSSTPHSSPSPPIASPSLLPPMQLALYTMFNWGNTVRENVRSLTVESTQMSLTPHLPLPPPAPPALLPATHQLALYTMFNWGNTVRENVRSLTGRTAPPAFLQKLTYLCWNHHRAILAIDTVRAYTFGASYFTEVDVVLPEDMPLKEAHDIGEALQNKLERLPEIERAFVHLDYEVSHRPEHHHHLSTFNVSNGPSPTSFSSDPRSP